MAVMEEFTPVRIISAPMMPIKDFNTSDGGLGMTYLDDSIDNYA